MNLCTNAYQAMGTEGGVLELTLDEVEIDASFHADAGCPVPGKYMRLSVSDTGSGIEPGVIGRIFEPFSQPETQRGTGLGLSTVHGIVTGYGGAVTVRSAVGEGSVFEIYLPQMAAEIPVESAMEELPAPVPSASCSWMTIPTSPDGGDDAAPARLPGRRVHQQPGRV